MRLRGQSKKRRVLIASNHALFGQGLRSLLQERKRSDVEIVGIVSNLEETLRALDRLDPDLILVDYDDESLNREEFLTRFVEGEKKLRVVLLSLQSAQQAIVYDRRTMAAAEIDDWLEEYSILEQRKDRPSGPENSEHPAAPGRRNMNKRLKKATHLVIASILVIVVSLLLIFSYTAIRILPVAASLQARPIDQLFRLEFMVIAFLFSLIVVFMLYSILVFRRRKGDLTDAEHIEGSTKLEFVWTMAPLLTVLVFAYLGGDALAQTLAPEPKPLRVDVTGRQWTWSFAYPDYGIVSDKLYLPVDKQAVLRLGSADVIHSFWVPEFRVKQDALPGGAEFVRDLRLTPSMTGEFKVRCAELCGLQHTYMESPVVVVSQSDFEAWAVKESGLSDDPVERGQKWATQFGCLSCHSLDGSKIVGPTWKGVFGSTETFTDGSSATVDEAYILESIHSPNAKVVQGYPAGVMPQQFIDPVSKQPITDQQIADLIAFIQSQR